jgi:hypothetical protein
MLLSIVSNVLKKLDQNESPAHEPRKKSKITVGLAKTKKCATPKLNHTARHTT